MVPNFILLILSVSVILFLCPQTTAAGLWVCKPCKDEAECNADPEEVCVWGEARNACFRRVCAKGPGERCGGPLDILGQCGEGMMCSKKDERCHGCSLQTMQCYNSAGSS
ncbi:neuroparsin-A-like [Diabrotica virgifera virgifera]|uniref:Neuroparsin-A-like n=1 Tax=Diabrotica virgifera virgifera TaxID=50390 RepID=A0A6P7GKD7_DIAVI|nr:neuroparsin-A-like [Diabrotica virgifera virgifera]XP_028150370.1 neuroparsin-A-like [Diabrotica virgifera virgifera]